MQGAAGSEYVIHKDDVPYRSATSEYRSGIFGDGKCSGYVPGLSLDVESDLCLGPAPAHEDVRAYGYVKFTCKS